MQLGVEETGKFVKVRKTFRNFLAYRAESKLSAVRDSAEPSGPFLFNKNVIRKIIILLMRWNIWKHIKLTQYNNIKGTVSREKLLS